MYNLVATLLRTMRPPCTRPNLTLLIALAVASAAAHPTSASTTSEVVNAAGNMNIYGAGHATAPGPGGFGGGILPVEIAIPAGTGRTVQFSLSGTIDYGGCCPTNGPDGNAATVTVPQPSYGGLAGCDLATRARYLSAVFLDDSEPADPAPDSLVIAAVDFTELSPALRQIFFVGDGLTGEGTGATQTFHIPDGATRLFMGCMDRCSTSPNVPGWYDDNSGNVTGTATFDVTTGVGSRPPTTLRLDPNYPNPFNASTTVTFATEREGTLDLSVYDVQGRLIRTLLHRRKGSGTHTVTWDGRDGNGNAVGSGIYYCRLKSRSASSTRTMVLLR